MRTLNIHKPKYKFKLLSYILISFSLLTVFLTISPQSVFAADDVNTTMAQVSEAVAEKVKAGEKGSTSLHSVATNWSFTGQSNASGAIFTDKEDNSYTTGWASKIGLLSGAGKGYAGNELVYTLRMPDAFNKWGLDNSGDLGHKPYGLLDGLLRWIAIILISIGVGLAFVVNLMLSVVFWIIKNLNPASIITSLIDMAGFNPIGFDSGFSSFAKNNAILKPVVDFFSQGLMVNLIRNILGIILMSLVAVIIGAFLALIFGWSGSNTSGSLSKPGRSLAKNMSKWITWSLKKMLSIFVAPMLLLVLFQSAIDIAGSGTTTPAALINRQFYSTFIDYKGWVENSRMWLPNFSTIPSHLSKQSPLTIYNKTQEDGTSAPAGSIKNTILQPDTVLLINAYGAHSAEASTAISRTNIDLKSGSNDNSFGQSTDLETSFKKTESYTGISLGEGGIFSLLWDLRPTQKNRYTAEDYAQNVIKDIANSDKFDDIDIKDSNDPLKTVIEAIDKNVKEDSLTGISESITANTASRSALGLIVPGPARITYNNGYTGIASYTTNAVDDTISKRDNSGLSPLGMWNYLNTYTLSSGRVGQMISTKTKASDNSSGHAPMLIASSSFLDSLGRILLMFAVCAVCVLPIGAATYKLGQIAFDGVVSIPNHIKVLIGSPKAIASLINWSINAVSGVALVAVMAALLPALVQGMISLIQSFTTNSVAGPIMGIPWVFGIAQILEAVLLLLITYFLMKSVVVMMKGSSNLLGKFAGINDAPTNGFNKMAQDAGKKGNQLNAGLDALKDSISGKGKDALKDSNLAKNLGVSDALGSDKDRSKKDKTDSNNLIGNVKDAFNKRGKAHDMNAEPVSEEMLNSAQGDLTDAQNALSLLSNNAVGDGLLSDDDLMDPRNMDSKLKTLNNAKKAGLLSDDQANTLDNLQNARNNVDKSREDLRNLKQRDQINDKKAAAALAGGDLSDEIADSIEKGELGSIAKSPKQSLSDLRRKLSNAQQELLEPGKADDSQSNHLGMQELQLAHEAQESKLDKLSDKAVSEFPKVKDISENELKQSSERLDSVRNSQKLAAEKLATRDTMIAETANQAIDASNSELSRAHVQNLSKNLLNDTAKAIGKENFVKSSEVQSLSEQVSNDLPIENKAAINSASKQLSETFAQGNIQSSDVLKMSAIASNNQAKFAESRASEAVNNFKAQNPQASSEEIRQISQNAHRQAISESVSSTPDTIQKIMSYANQQNLQPTERANLISSQINKAAEQGMIAPSAVLGSSRNIADNIQSTTEQMRQNAVASQIETYKSADSYKQLQQQVAARSSDVVSATKAFNQNSAIAHGDFKQYAAQQVGSLPVTNYGNNMQLAPYISRHAGNGVSMGEAINLMNTVSNSQDSDERNSAFRTLQKTILPNTIKHMDSSEFNDAVKAYNNVYGENIDKMIIKKTSMDKMSTDL